MGDLCTLYTAGFSSVLFLSSTLDTLGQYSLDFVRKSCLNAKSWLPVAAPFINMQLKCSPLAVLIGARKCGVMEDTASGAITDTNENLLNSCHPQINDQRFPFFILTHLDVLPVQFQSNK